MMSFHYIPFIAYVSSITFLTLRALHWLETPYISFSLLLSQFAERNLKLNAKVPTLTGVQLNLGLSVYLDV